MPYIWRTLPFAILLVHAALQGIDKDLYEAAAVDGATAWQRFWHITLPLLRPIIVVILVLRTSFAFAVFEEILAITQGGPGDATWVAAWYSYKIVVRAALQHRRRRRLGLRAGDDRGPARDRLRRASSTAGSPEC